MGFDLSQWVPEIRGVHLLLAWLSIVIVGILLGIRGTITVFRNYNDLALVFFVGASFILVLVTTTLKGDDGLTLFTFFLTLDALLTLWIVGRTFLDNLNPIWFMIALITKTTLAVLFLINLIEFITPSGSSARKRSASRRSSFIYLLFGAPLTYALIKEKTGFFVPPGIRR